MVPFLNRTIPLLDLCRLGHLVCLPPWQQLLRQFEPADSTILQRSTLFLVLALMHLSEEGLEGGLGDGT